MLPLAVFPAAEFPHAVFAPAASPPFEVETPATVPFAVE
jgi:hypothetical protein